MDLKELAVKSDSRGSLVEAFKMPNDGQIMYIVIRPHEVRGGHYHLRKTERFLVIRGTAMMSVKDRNTGNVMRVATTESKPMVITVAPNNTHEIEADYDGAVVLIWADEVYNPKDPDTIQEEI